MWACDFETHPGPDETWVWAWGACSIDSPDIFNYGSSIETFWDWVKNKTNIYFHNLKFDGAFICDYLFKHGWKYAHEKPKRKEFSALISDSGQWYSITINTGRNKIKIFDSLKKLPMSISAIAKAFNLAESKLSIDYRCFRPPGCNLSKKTLAYLKNDCTILAKALKTQFSQNLCKLTTSADALDFFKSNLKTKFTDLFPVLPLDIDKEIRAAYRGGWVYCKDPGVYDNTICYDVNGLYSYAMLQPMPYGQPQYFSGEYVFDPDYPLYIISFKADFVIKPNMLPTLQLKHSRFHQDTEYVTRHFGFASYDVITLTSVDFKIFQDHYDILEIEFIGGYKFKQINDIFKPYIDHWGEIKANSIDGIRLLAKLMLNALYGKYGKNPNTTRKDLIYYDNKIATKTGQTEFSDPIYIPLACFVTAYARITTISAAQSVYEHFIYADTDSIHLRGHPSSLKIPIHGTKLGHWKLEYQSVRGKYLKAKRYMVEISAHPMQNDLEISKQQLVAHSNNAPGTNKWRKNPGIMCSLVPHQISKAARLNLPLPPQTKFKVTCAGMPQNIKDTLSFEDFEQGNEFEGKLVPKYVPGGVVLVPTSFSLN